MHKRELAIQLFDGTIRRVPLVQSRITLGRSSENDLAYPDDTVLSRRHLVIEFDGQNWWVEDLGSTNGTQLNQRRLEGRQRLQVADTIGAGRLSISFTVPREPENGVEFFGDVTEPRMRTSSGEARWNQSQLQDGDDEVSVVVENPIKGNSRFQALLDAGREISSDRPLDELFQVIIALLVRSVGASRGVIMVNEGGTLVPRAMLGSGFKISAVVRDRVMLAKEPILILDASRHEVLSSSTTIQRQRVKSLMAVPLQTQDRVLGLVYVDSQDEVRFFLHEDLSLLTVIANMAAIKIEQTQRDFS